MAHVMSGEDEGKAMPMTLAVHAESLELRCQELEEALRYWMPNDSYSIATNEDRRKWREHKALLTKENDNGQDG